MVSAVIDEGAGVLQALSWKQSMEICEREYEVINRMARQRCINLRKTNRATRRELMTPFYKDTIHANYRNPLRLLKEKQVW